MLHANAIEMLVETVYSMVNVQFGGEFADPVAGSEGFMAWRALKRILRYADECDVLMKRHAQASQCGTAGGSRLVYQGLLVALRCEPADLYQEMCSKDINLESVD